MQAANSLNMYYQSIGGQVMEPSANHKTNNITPLEQITIHEVKQLLKHLDTTKATSSDDFPTWISKQGREDICIPLADILNCMLRTCTFPERWKVAQVVPVPKTPQPAACKDYRPISLLYHLGKLAEQVIIDRILPRLNGILDCDQFAYRQSLGTTDALVHFVHNVVSALDSNSTSSVQCAFLDFSKAFNCLQPKLLLQKCTP